MDLETLRGRVDGKEPPDTTVTYAVGELDRSLFHVVPVKHLSSAQLKTLDRFLSSANNEYCESAMIMMYAVVLGEFPYFGRMFLATRTHGGMCALAVVEEEQETLYIHYVCVKDRCKGHGTRFMKQMDRHLPYVFPNHRGYKLTSVDARTDKFYERLGMVPRSSHLWMREFLKK